MNSDATRGFPNTDRRPAPHGFRQGFACAALAFTTMIAVGVISLEPHAAAQDGTSAATPTPPTNCILPTVTVPDGPREGQSPIVPFPPLTSEETPVATPLASPIASPQASPVASPQASPIAITPTASLEIDITATTRVLANCLTEYQLGTVVELTSDTFRGQLLGAAEDLDGDTYTALAGTLTPLPYSIVSINNIRGTSRSTAEAIVTYTVAHQLRSGVWTFQLITAGADRRWIVAFEEPREATAPGGAPNIAVDIADHQYQLSPDEIDGASVQLNGTNDDPEDHEMLVIKLADDVSSDILLTSFGPTLPAGVEFIGQLTILAGSTGSMVLTNLQPGDYIIVCLLPDEEGLPHLATGMETTFTVR